MDETGTASGRIQITKLVDADRDLVFAAFTEAEHLRAWWGPESFDVSSATSDPRPGGAFTIVMRSPEGLETPVEGTYVVVDRPNRLVAETTAVGPDGTKIIEGRTTVEFVDHDGKTEIRLVAEARALVPEANPALGGMELGWTSSLRRLDDHLTGALDRQIMLARMLQAPREQVFAAWTDPQQVAAWWGPNGFTLTSERMDVRPGGEWIVTMHGPDGVDQTKRIVYEEIEAPSRLVYRHAGPDDGDPSFRGVVTFDAFMGGTVLTLKAVYETAAARDEGVATYDAIEGGNQMLDRLVAYVASR
jgi:uncharacterized protein YndB with AHSA1/START domain